MRPSWAWSVGTAARQVCSMPILALGRRGSHATSRVAQASPRKGGRTRRFMRYRSEVPQSESGSGREPRPAAEEARPAACFLGYTADSDRVGSAAVAW